MSKILANQKRLEQGFPNSFTKSPPFQKFEKKSPPIVLYSNFPLDAKTPFLAKKVALEILF